MSVRSGLAGPAPDLHEGRRRGRRKGWRKTLRRSPVVMGILPIYVALRTLPRRVARWTTQRALQRYQAWSEARPAQLLRAMRTCRRFGLWAPFAARAEAVLTARTAGWEAAAPLFRALAAAPRKRVPLTAAAMAALRTRPQPTPPVHLVVPAASRSVDLPPDMAGRIVVYTTCFGRAVRPDPLFGVPPSVRCLCFTDQPLAVPGWEIVPVAAGTATDLDYKLRPHRVLPTVAPAADLSLYVAPDRVIAGNLHTLLTRWLQPRFFALWRHPECGDWHDLVEDHLLQTPAATVALLAQAAAAERAAVPRREGAYDTGVLWRRHGEPAVADLMERWWGLQADLPGPDEITLYHLLHGADSPSLQPAVMPEALGPAPYNAFFARKAAAAPPAAPRRQRRPGLPLPITFLYSEARKTELMTLMRGKQLSDLVTARLGADHAVHFVSDRQLDDVRDQVVILNYGFLGFASMTQLKKLRRQNIALITDWQDGVVEPAKVALCDAQMAMSPRQALDFGQLYPATPAFHVTHHVNPAIRRYSVPNDRLHTLYFGASWNTSIPASLRDVITVIDGHQIQVDFDDFMPSYNCHWIVRRYVPIDQLWLVRGASPLRQARMRLEQWKPFLKGFVAARCGAVVLVTRDDDNAMHYLGDDYPFYAASLTPADLETAWLRATAAFGGPEWRHAEAIMQQVELRSSDTQVATEFKAMLDTVVA